MTKPGKTRCYLSALGIVNALGNDSAAVATALFAGSTLGMAQEEGWMPEGLVRIGKVRDELPSLIGSRDDSRNNRMLLAATGQIEPELADAIARHGRARIGVVLGTSTSGISEGEAALAMRAKSGELPGNYDYAQQEIGAPAPFLARHLGLDGPAYTVSTACTSSAKAFVSARNLLDTGLCDAVIVGGVDTLCRLTLNGFGALESTSPALCLPLSVNRRGINIGEGAAVFLMTREPASIEFLGAGESSDAHHISAPHPEGLGAEAAMRAALADADLSSCDIDYLNLHATATPKNDEMESRAVARVFPGGVPVSGTKPMTGHTLGAAGATELAFCWLALQHDRLPPHVWDNQPDPALPHLQTVPAGMVFRRTQRRACMSNSFAFGGSNASLIIGDAR
ncbi:MAG TPA: beta-ketoacyl-[acyl-carrier-protein] synthase family protein [Rhodocyclaceae bacterium]|nr:beta-ketoacyl-[acyl-carrier-protein] synthase family protein [Rhodocyclaceae bacterium]